MTRAAMAGVGTHVLRDQRVELAMALAHEAMAGVGTHVLRDLLGYKTTAMGDRYVRAVGNPMRDAREHIGAAMAAMMHLRKA